MSFPAERIAESNLFENAVITPLGGSQRTIRIHWVNEDSPTTIGNVVVVNDVPQADVLTTEITYGAKPIVEESTLVRSKTGESFTVSKVGIDEDGFTPLTLKR